MKIFNLKSKAIIAVTTLGLALSINSANANEQTTSYEEVVAAYISAQGKQIMTELAINLENNIANQIQNFRNKHSEASNSQIIIENIAVKTATNKTSITED
ncbi:MAG: hypothetical protein JKX78_07635 [Alteromonadaceae bacterium]|nr:hypothetical protein [Alteromonadaceae bacterium]